MKTDSPINPGELGPARPHSFTSPPDCVGLQLPQHLQPPAGGSPLNISFPFLVFPRLYFSGDRDGKKKSRDVTILPSSSNDISTPV